MFRVCPPILLPATASAHHKKTADSKVARAKVLSSDELQVKQGQGPGWSGPTGRTTLLALRGHVVGQRRQDPLASVGETREKVGKRVSTG